MSRFFTVAILLFTLAAPAVAGEPAVTDDERTELQELLRLQRTELEAVRAELKAQRDELKQIREIGERKHVTKEEPERVSFGNAVRIRDGEVVQEAVAFGNSVHIDGRVRGDATAFGGNVEVRDGGIVEGDAIAFGGHVIVHPGGTVNGDRMTMSVSGEEVAPEAQGIQATAALPTPSAGMWAGLYHRLILLLSFAGAGVLVVGLVPNRVGRIAEALEERPIRSAFVGAFSTGFMGLSVVLFAITILGLPVSFLLVALMGLAWLMGLVGLCQAVGDRLPMENNHGRWVAFLVATVLLTCMGSLPWVGWLVVMGASVIGMGAALSTRFGAR